MFKAYVNCLKCKRENTSREFFPEIPSRTNENGFAFDPIDSSTKCYDGLIDGIPAFQCNKFEHEISKCWAESNRNQPIL